MPRLSRIHLVVLSHNRLDCLPRLFENLVVPAANYDAQVTIVDNASGPAVREYLGKYRSIPGMEVVFVEENLGVAAGRNIGFKRGNRECIVYLDDDGLFPVRSLERVPKMFDQLPSAGLLAFRVVNGVTGIVENDHGLTRSCVGNFHGAGHAIRRAVFERVGYLDESCFFGAEEIEFSMRARNAGFPTVYVPEIEVRHFSLKHSEGGAARRRLLWARNYAMVLFRYLPFGTAALFSLRSLVAYAWSGARHIGFRSVLLPPAMIVGMFRGLIHRTPLNSENVAFYTNPETRPDLGNISLSSKMRKKLASGKLGNC